MLGLGPLSSAPISGASDYLAISTLSDDFNDNSTDLVKWPGTFFSSAGYAETGGQLVITCANLTGGSNYAGYVSGNYNLGNSSAYVKVVQVANVATAADTVFQLQLDSNNWLRWIQENGTLFAQKFVGGVRNNIGTLTYDSTTHAWWQIRESAGITYWDTSPDGTTWTNQFSAANPIGVTALSVNLTAGTFQSETSPGTAIFDNMNVPGSSVVSVSVTQVAATITATGGTQTVASSQFASISQLAATVTATGGTQTVASTNNISISQVAATITAAGGTQSVTTIRNVSISQVAATITASGGVQSVATINNVSISQVAGMVTVTGGTQIVTTSSLVNASITQVAAAITANGGAQSVSSTRNATVSQLAATITATGGTQTIASMRNVAIAQLAAGITVTGGTQSVNAISSVNIAQVAASITVTGGLQAVSITISTNPPIDYITITSIEDFITITSYEDSITISKMADDYIIIRSSEDSIFITSVEDSITVTA